MGLACTTASSAARLSDKIASSQTLPMPMLRNVFSAFCASGGSNILTAAFPKKPLTTES